MRNIFVMWMLRYLVTLPTVRWFSNRTKHETVRFGYQTKEHEIRIRYFVETRQKKKRF